eukprot:TRINITY_DN7585_c1_g1_i1.p3 TRINITY_DN7585_c1_g1~~TRINITY_DN7585_c1_g1_i1.p3  ORF type:complete len:148 (-),score=16.11 TRINITY_DN7585_c1_g1_i1:440-883(-)
MQNGLREGRAPDIDIYLEIVLAAMVAAGERLSEQAGGVVPDGGADDPRPLDDPVHDLESRVAERVVRVDEPVEERVGRDRIVRRKVEHGAVVVAAGDLEVHGEDEGFQGSAGGLGLAEGGDDAVVGSGEEVVELAGGAEPVDAGRAE